MRRFLPEMEREAELLRSLRVEILSPRSFTSTGEQEGFVFVDGDDEGAPSAIQARHLACLADGDFVRLVCPGGYVGQSAAEEIGHALALGVPVYATEPPADQVLAGQVVVAPEIKVPIEELELTLGLLAPKLRTLGRLQRWTSDMAARRGFAEETLEELLVLFLEEAAELVAAAAPDDPRFADVFASAARLGAEARAARKGGGIATADTRGRQGSVPDEIADLQIYLALIASKTGNELGATVEEKISRDLSRHWQ
jgi:NTP pyrophosphatase (non-canonical NTP hydrolase)